MTDRLLHRHVAMISDLHVGDPNTPRLEDFNRDAQFEALLAGLPARANGPVSLVIAGDFVDFPQIFPELGKSSPGDRFGTTEAESVARIEAAIAGHPRVFGALRSFVQDGNQVLVLPGNHDVDFHFDQVFGVLRRAAGDPPEERLSFVKEALIAEQGVYIEHGNQVSYDNYFESWKAPILDAPDGKKRIERPWGTMFMDLVYNDAEEAYPFINKVYPHGRMAAIVMRLVKDDTKVSLRTIGKFAAFFLLKGRKMIEGHILGDHDPMQSDAVSRAQVEALVADLGPMDPSRRSALVEETWSLVQPPAAGGTTGLLGGGESSEEGEPVPVTGLLGRTDERGLDELANSIIRKGKTKVIAFGHTHEPVIDSKSPSAGKVFQVFNTGGWIPRILVPAGKTPSKEELAASPLVHDLRCLRIDLRGGEGGGPTGVLDKVE